MPLEREDGDSRFQQGFAIKKGRVRGTVCTAHGGLDDCPGKDVCISLRNVFITSQFNETLYVSL